MIECQSKTDSIKHSDPATDPEMFRTTKIWGGRKETVTECLAHAAASEQRGQKVEIIRH